MIIKQFELTSAPGKYKLTVRNHQKLLRYCQRVKSAGVDRTESFYIVCKLSGEKI